MTSQPSTSQPLMSQLMKDLKEEFKKPMVIIIREIRFKLKDVEDEDNAGDAAPKDKKSMINEIFGQGQKTRETEEGSVERVEKETCSPQTSTSSR